MGTDAAPAVEVAGAVSALKSPESDFDIILVGDSDVLQADAIAMLGTSVGVLPIRELVVEKADISALPPDSQRLFSPTSSDNVAALQKPSQDHPVVQQLVAAYTSATF